MKALVPMLGMRMTESCEEVYIALENIRKDT
jgi:hypothetical protein